MLNKKNVMVRLLSLCILCIGLILCRYVFFEIHGMKQWPELLFIVGLFFGVVSFLVKANLTPVFISLAYIVGFLVGLVFQTDGVDAGGARTNSLWIIWTLVFICFTVAGIVSELIVASRKELNR